MKLLIFLMLSLISLVFSDVLLNNYDLRQELDSKKIIIITAGFKSCHDCYKILYDELILMDSNFEQSVVFLCEYRESVLQRKQQRNILRKMVHGEGEAEIRVVFDDENNSFLKENKLEISPSLVLISENRTLILYYKEIFKNDIFDQVSKKTITDFFY